MIILAICDDTISQYNIDFEFVQYPHSVNNILSLVLVFFVILTIAMIKKTQSSYSTRACTRGGIKNNLLLKPMHVLVSFPSNLIFKKSHQLQHK
jgi:hypothetical protein